MRRPHVLAITALAVIVATACATNGATTAVGNGGIAAPAPAEVAKRDASSVALQSGTTTPQNGIPTFASPDRSLILTANLSFRAQDPWGTADKVRVIASGLGGDLLGLSQTGSGEQRSAMVTIRVPSNRFDDALTQLKQLDGEVVTSSVDAKDVTDQFVDLNARLVALKAQEQQYLTLLARATTVDEILKVQNALVATRTQIEQIQGQVNSLKTRIDFSTITMSIAPLVSIPGASAGAWDPARTFAQATAALTALFRVIGDAAIWMLVFLWVPLAAVGLAMAATRIRRPRPA